MLLRVGMGIQLALYQLSTQREWLRLLDGQSRHISEAILAAESPFIPRVGWLIHAGSALGIGETAMLIFTWWVLSVLALLLIIGLFCRTAAITAWLLHLAVVKSASISYGMDGFTTTGLFYLALSPLPDSFSFDWRFRKIRRHSSEPSSFLRRVLQLHLCCIYFFSGLTKLLGNGWWNGENIWRALTRPPFGALDPSFVAHWKFLLPATGIVISLLEFAYIIFIWPRLTRNTWLLGIIFMHIGIGVFIGDAAFRPHHDRA